MTLTYDQERQRNGKCWKIFSTKYTAIGRENPKRVESKEKYAWQMSITGAKNAMAPELE